MQAISYYQFLFVFKRYSCPHDLMEAGSSEVKISCFLFTPKSHDAPLGFARSFVSQTDVAPLKEIMTTTDAKHK